MSHSQTVIIAPDLATAEALYLAAPENALAEPDKTLLDEGGRYAWIHHGFTEELLTLARKTCKVVDYIDPETGIRWDKGNREAFTPKSVGEGK